MNLFGFFQRQHTPPTYQVRSTSKTCDSVALSLSTLMRMDWHAFEHLVELYFVCVGVRVERLDENDRTGLAFRLMNPGESSPYAWVKCLGRSPEDMDLNIIEHLPSMADALQIPRTLVVMKRSSSSTLRQLARKGAVKCLDLNGFWELLLQLPPAGLRRVQDYLKHRPIFAPYCPHCGVLMVEQMEHHDLKIFACPHFPKCQYTVRQAREIPKEADHSSSLNPIR